MSAFYRFLLAAALALGTIAPAMAAAPSIVIDGSNVSPDVPALAADGRVLVPLRGVFERLGAHVSYDAATQTASASLDGHFVQVTVGSRTAYVDGKRYDLDVGAREFGGRVMIPLRFVAQSLGVSVDYDGPSNTVVIVSGHKPGSFAAMTSGPAIIVSHTGQGPSVEDMSPSSGTIVGSEYPSIYARFAGGSSAVDPASVRMVVDGQDVTGSSTISSAYVSYTPTSPMMTGLHSVTITGNSDSGATFTSGWSFRIDAGSVSDYTSTSFAGGGGYGYGYSPYGYGYGGYGGFGWPVHGFGQFGYYPPGFSLFTPGSLFFVSGGIINVVFVSQFFPAGNGVFTISGFPGTYPLTPWLGNPGFFWGTAAVPFGVTAHSAIIAARFETPGGRKFIVHSMAPLEIQGKRHTLPADLRYAVVPRVVNHPTSLRNAVTFERIVSERVAATHPVRLSPAEPHHIAWENAPTTPRMLRAPGWSAPKEPALQPGHPVTPVMHPIEHPVIHPVIHPAMTMPFAPGMQRFPMSQWQFQAPSRPAFAPVATAPK
ncbi:MAG: hypothetical protein JO195_05625 [Candidatus Eremiobacteraeota bacterium]|nr:hypothetical protein [Candidatus Eremiobacteraeota bacterium]